MAVITSADYFIVNGVSSASVGLYVDTPPVPPMASQRVTTWSTGVDMDGHSPDNVFDNITLTVKAYSFFPSTFDLAAVYAFLADARKLMFSRFPNRFLKVVQVGSVQPKQKHDGARIELDIMFLCEPWKYHTSNAEVDVTQTHTIHNEGTRYSRPVYKCTITKLGYDSVLAVNGQTCIIDRAAASPLWIDTERMIAYDENGENQTPMTSGIYPFLASGDNTLSLYTPISGGQYQNQGLTVIGNWRDY